MRLRSATVLMKLLQRLQIALALVSMFPFFQGLKL